MKGSFKAMGISAMPESQTLFNSVLYPRWFYPKPEASQISLFDEPIQRVSAISEYARARFSEHYGRNVDDDSIFYYVFGLLSHSGFIELYSANLTKEVPSIPLLENFDEITAAGKKLFESQVSIEAQKPYSAKLDWSKGPTEAQHWAPFKPTIVDHGENFDIKFNAWLVIRELPKSALSVKFGTRSAVEWVLDRISPSIDKNSQIENQAIEFFDTPQGTLDYLLKVVTASAEFAELGQKLDSITLK
jgi:predicted helicase